MRSFRQEIIFIINLYFRTLSYIEEAYAYLSERVDKKDYAKDFDRLLYHINQVKLDFSGCKLIYADSRIKYGKPFDLAFLECLHLYSCAGSGLYNLGEIPKFIERLDSHIGLSFYRVEGEVFRGESMEPSKQAIHACMFLDSYVSRIKAPHISRIADKYGIDIEMFNKNPGYKYKKK